VLGFALYWNVRTFRVIAEQEQARSHRQSTGVSPDVAVLDVANARCFGIEAAAKLSRPFPVATLLSSLHTLRMNCCWPPSKREHPAMFKAYW